MWQAYTPNGISTGPICSDRAISTKRDRALSATINYCSHKEEPTTWCFCGDTRTGLIAAETYCKSWKVISVKDGFETVNGRD